MLAVKVFSIGMHCSKKMKLEKGMVNVRLGAVLPTKICVEMKKTMISIL
mgnify:CR=1 FL=1